MKHLISIWAGKKEEEECIKTFYDLSVDPFKVGMVFWLNLEEYYPADRNKMINNGWSNDLLGKYIAEWEEKRLKFHNKTVKIIEQTISLDLKMERFRTDYYIEIVTSK